MNPNNNGIILFDGDCNYCTNVVLWVIKRDKKNYFLFSATQVQAGEKLLAQRNLQQLKNTSVILVEGEEVFIKSDAVFHIAKHLGIYKIFYPLIYLPRFIRDGIYNIIANNRYKWFGKRETCYVPDENLKNRFL